MSIENIIILHFRCNIARKFHFCRTNFEVIDPDPKWTGQGILAMVIVILWSFMMLGVLLYFLLMSDTMSKAKTADEEQEMEDAEVFFYVLAPKVVNKA